MKNLTLAILVLSFLAACTTKQPKPETLKDAFDGLFYVGTALNTFQVDGVDVKADSLVKEQFNSIVAENCMKSMNIQPQKGVFTFDDADKFVAYGEQNGMHIIGHTLIWHSQAPRWLFTDDEGNDVTPEELAARMREHIFTLVGRYKGRVHGWDVVNEAINDDGSFRNSKFYQILGEDYIRLAFEYAHEADPDAELYYNDYSMNKPGKRNGVVTMVKSLQQQGIKIDGIGMQGHYLLAEPSVEEIEESIVAFAGLGVKVMFTELDITVLPWPDMGVSAEVSLSHEFQAEFNPYAEGMTPEADEALNQRFVDIFALFIKHSDKISRVTLWGVADHHSWRNNWPIRGRTDYPLLFDRNYENKPAVDKIIEAAIAHKAL
ncbi:MAG: endo-1,4-beta-xylanase [Prolixibacteraceae bacterium]|jgi:endo-1,4-beta-xylanase|nr:endo-1,4-beta-xylanase [Prolixibacteraceae bacterium]